MKYLKYYLISYSFKPKVGGFGFGNNLIGRTTKISAKNFNEVKEELNKYFIEDNGYKADLIILNIIPM